jgi:hypothetical protein
MKTSNLVVRSFPLRTIDIHSCQPTISLEIGENHDIIPKIHRPSFSLHDTRMCHFDKCNFLIGCHHSSQTVKNYRSNNHYYSSKTNTNVPEIVFAESTCQLIREAWLPPVHDQQMNFES